MAKIELEWAIAEDPDDPKISMVRERIVGTDKVKFYPMPSKVALAFVRARRAMFDRIASSTDAVRMFEREVPLLKN